MIDAVSATVPATPPLRPQLAAGQLLYVVDVAATTASGALVMELMTRDRKANGDWGKPKPARVTAAGVASLPDPAEREILQRLSGGRSQFEWGYNGYGPDLCRVELRGVLVTDVVPRACATGRCMVRVRTPARPPVVSETPILRRAQDERRVEGPSNVPSLSPVAWDAGAPWTFAIGVYHVPDESPGGYAIQGWLRRDNERMELSDALLLHDGVLFTKTHAAVLNHGGAFTWLKALQRTGRVTVPAEARDELVDALLPLGPLLAALPDDLRVGGVHEGELDAVARQDLRVVAVGAAVRHVGADDVLAGLDEGRNGRDRRHPGRERAGPGPPFEHGHVLLERGARRVLRAGVLVALVLPESFLHVGGRLVDRHGYGPRQRVGRVAGVDAIGGEAHGRFAPALSSQPSALSRAAVGTASG